MTLLVDINFQEPVSDKAIIEALFAVDPDLSDKIGNDSEVEKYCKQFVARLNILFAAIQYPRNISMFA